MRAASLSTDLRETGGALTVTALSSGFGAILMTAANALTNATRATGLDSGSETIKTLLVVISWVFLGIALFVGGIVTVNTFGTIVAGRAHRLSLLRLLGSSARSLRRATVSEGAAVGLLGAVVGLAGGIGLAQAALWAGHHWWGMDATIAAPAFTRDMIAPAVMAAIVTVAASWVGSRTVLGISPMQAFGVGQVADETAEEPAVRRRMRSRAVALEVVGLALLFGGVAIGVMANPMGVLIALPGGMLSFGGFMAGSRAILPRLLSAGDGWARSGPARLAARNTARNPRRTTRSTVGIVIGVGLVTMFAVAGATYRHLVYTEVTTTSTMTAEESAQVLDALNYPIIILMALVGFSALIAGVGLVTSMSLSALQRRHETAVLRALGLTRPQVRALAIHEGARMSLVATLVGVILGAFYGWAGIASTLGTYMRTTGQWWPVLPWYVAVIVALAAVALTVATSLVTVRRTLAVRPVEALAMA